AGARRRRGSGRGRRGRRRGRVWRGLLPAAGQRERDHGDDDPACAQTMLHRGCRRPRLSHPRRSPHNARMPNWIDTPAALRARTGQLPAAIGLDTEFIRERTSWPQLALVQVALGPGDDDILLVDPLAPGMHEALAGLLQDPAV